MGTVWEHMGDLSAVVSSGTCVLNTHTFAKVVKQHPCVHWMSVMYARQFIIRINERIMSDIFQPPHVRQWEPEAIASAWFVADIPAGGSEGGARSRSAKAVAQQANGFYVIKCSEDSRGKLIIHLHKKTVVFNSPLKPKSAEEHEEIYI